MKLSIITSLKPNEVVESSLKDDLMTLARGLRDYIEVEWLLVSAHQGTLEACCFPNLANGENLKVKKITGGHSRASCMNLGVNESEGELLWFLHADSSFCGQDLAKLFQKINFDLGIFYFDLQFEAGLWAMKINEVGVRFRCRYLKTPFGDQGLLMTKKVFWTLGAYNEEASYGEDHLLIRSALRNKVKVLPIGARLVTSPRKYQENGWLKTTITHQYLWYKQLFYWYEKQFIERIEKESK